MKRILTLLAFGAALCAMADVPTILDVPGLDETRVVFDGQGKGTGLGWDLGILKRLAETSKAFQQNRVVIAANSGVSFLAAYFTCRGFTPQSIAGAEAMLKDFDPKVVNENGPAKLVRLLFKLVFLRDRSKQNLERLATAFDHSAIEPMLERVLDDNRCVPRLPTILFAGNAEVLDNRDSSASLSDLLKNRTDATDMKEVDYDHYLVKDTSGKVLGKPCTYFATPDLIEKLKQIPWEERACDLRPMRTAEDLRLAVLASVSEPTYFPWQKEPHPELITGLPDGASPIEKRSYNGGFTNSPVAQDLRRVLPQVVVVGSGRPPYADLDRGLVRGLYSLKLAEALARSNWWLDVEVSPSQKQWEEFLHQHPQVPAWVSQSVDWGYDRAKRCFESEECRPDPVKAPLFDWANGDASHTRLATQRGREIFVGALQ